MIPVTRSEARNPAFVYAARAPGSDPACARWQTSQKGTLIWSRRPGKMDPAERPRKVQSRPVATRESGTPPPGRPGTSQADSSSAARARNTRPDIARRAPRRRPRTGAPMSSGIRPQYGGTSRAITMIWVRSPARPVAGRVRLLASRREGRGGQPGVSGRLPGDAASAPPAAPSAPIPPACQPAGPWRRAGPCPKPCSWRGRVRW